MPSERQLLVNIAKTLEDVKDHLCNIEGLLDEAVQLLSKGDFSARKSVQEKTQVETPKTETQITMSPETRAKLEKLKGGTV